MTKRHLPDFLIIPSILIEDPDVQPLDGYVYGVIYWATKMKNEECTMSNQYIADLLNSHARSISNAIARLKKKNYIQTPLNKQKQRIRLVPTISFDYRATSNDVGGVHQMMKGATSNDVHNNNISNNIYKGAVSNSSPSMQQSDYRTPHSNSTPPADSNQGLQKLPYDKLWEIAMKKNVSVADVQAVQQQVLDSIADGNKYKTKSVNLTVQKWIGFALQRGHIQRLDEMGRMILESDSPEKVAIREKFSAMIAKGEIK